MTSILSASDQEPPESEDQEVSATSETFKSRIESILLDCGLQQYFHLLEVHNCCLKFENQHDLTLRMSDFYSKLLNSRLNDTVRINVIIRCMANFLLLYHVYHSSAVCEQNNVENDFTRSLKYVRLSS